MSGAEGERVLPPYAHDPVPVPPPHIDFEVMKVQFRNQKVYDFEENEEVPMLSLISKSGSIIFKTKNSYFTLPLDTVIESMEDGSQVRHKCNRELEGAPYERDVDMEHRYYYVQGHGNFMVSFDEFRSALLQNYKILDLEETEEELENTASAQNVQRTSGVNRYGNPVNIVSGDHCQAGTKQKVFKLTPVILTDEAQAPPPSSGDKRRRTEDDAAAADILRGLRRGGRRFTRKQCKKFTCAKMGFTQKASCRPYKNCYKSKKKTIKSRK
jgi:hypothetical protein